MKLFLNQLINVQYEWVCKRKNSSKFGTNRQWASLNYTLHFFLPLWRVITIQNIDEPIKHRRILYVVTTFNLIFATFLSVIQSERKKVSEDNSPNKGK